MRKSRYVIDLCFEVELENLPDERVLLENREAIREALEQRVRDIFRSYTEYPIGSGINHTGRVFRQDGEWAEAFGIVDKYCLEEDYQSPSHIIRIKKYRLEEDYQ